MPITPPKNPSCDYYKTDDQQQNIPKSISGPRHLSLQIDFVTLLFTKRGWWRRFARFDSFLQSVSFADVSQQVVISTVDFLQLFLGLGTESFVMGESIGMPDVDQIAIGAFDLLKCRARLKAQNTVTPRNLVHSRPKVYATTKCCKPAERLEHRVRECGRSV